MIVIDASVAGKWVLEDEVDVENAFRILESHITRTEGIIAPDILFYEIANALATKSAVSSEQMTSALSKLYSLHLQVYHPNGMDVKQAAKLARKHKTSVYDMIYAVVARKHKTQLITADRKFVSQTGLRFIKLLKDIA